SRAGELNVIIEDERIKVMTGVFPDLTTAQRTLPNIRALGFTDAFVKSVARNQLLPVTPLSTGVKEDLIPIQLVAGTPPPAPANTSAPSVPTADGTQSRGSLNNPPSVPRPVVPGSTTSPTTPSSSPTTQVVTTVPSNSAGTSAPTIRGNIKRNSVINLQRLLKSQGYYDSTLDGFYGNGTTSAYQKMLTQNQNIQKYRLLIPFFATAISPNDPIMGWEEVQILQTICMDISNDTQASIGEGQRLQLYQSNTPLPIDQGTLLENWQQNRWAKIENWAATDSYLLETAQSLSFAYFQTLVRLEDFYMDKGFDAVPARHLAIATIKTIVGNALERF
ncbi:MAG: peptidoglycan-binding domain-containing protein, partial [Bacteroidota bacterium]